MCRARPGRVPNRFPKATQARLYNSNAGGVLTPPPCYWARLAPSQAPHRAYFDQGMRDNTAWLPLTGETSNDTGDAHATKIRLRLRIRIIDRDVIPKSIPKLSHLPPLRPRARQPTTLLRASSALWASLLAGRHALRRPPSHTKGQPLRVARGPRRRETLRRRQRHGVSLAVASERREMDESGTFPCPCPLPREPPLKEPLWLGVL